MDTEDLLTEERRARMAAERMLRQKEAELFEANRKLSRHARALSEDLVETRDVVEVVKGENTKVRADLERATTEGDIAKRRLWNSIQSIEDGFAVFDADSRLVIANAAYLTPFDGLECIQPGVHYQEVIEAAIAEGMVDLDGMPPAQWREEMLARWFAAAPEPRVVRLWDGTYIRMVDTRAPGGDTVSLGLNITGEMKREAALMDARNKAEAANRAKSAFLANMSHEIRTPMNGVVAMADLLAEGELGDEERLYVDTIRSSGEALLSIINDVLDYSKIEAEKLSLRPEAFDLERAILEVIQLLSPSIREKGLKVMLDYDMFLPTRFEGDPLRIRQVLTNLMGNAVKFTQKGHVLVRVVGLPEAGGTQQRLHLTIEDTGIGIPKDKVAHVFGEFNQVEDERNRAYEGTGLGLAISKQLIGLMGGEIWVESEEGVGSAFGISLSLPVVGELDAPAAPQWLQSALLVMDDDLHRVILEKRLLALGIAVASAASAADAQGLAGGVDVIFADQRLSDMGAAALVAMLRASGATAPVMMLAQAGQGADLEVKGAVKTLIKPLSRPDLLHALADLEPPAVAAPEAEDEVGIAVETPVETAVETPVETPVEASDQTPTEAPTEAPAEAPAAMPVFGSRRGPATAEATAPEAAQSAPEAQGSAATDAGEFAETAAAQNLFAVPPAPAVEAADGPGVPTPAPTLDTTLDTTPAPTLATPPAPQAPTSDGARQMRVLVAEDNKTNQLVFSKLVKACDIELVFAANGHEAVAKFDELRPDLVFMDISMPGMDGKEATRTIRAKEAEEGRVPTRIVALTAHAMEGDGDEILRHGLDKYLTKPFKKPAILAEIDSACPMGARAAIPGEVQVA